MHCTDTSYNRNVTPDDITVWHMGAKRLDDNQNAIYLGEKISIRTLKLITLKLPSGKIVNIDKTDGRGWKQVGYSDMIDIEGKLINLVPYTFDDIVDSSEVTNGASGYNSNSRHIVLPGGWSKDGKIRSGIMEFDDLYNEKVKKSLISYINMQKTIVPNIKVIGHNELTDKKFCPNFDVQKFLKLYL